MTATRGLLIGGVGLLIPILISVLSIDIGVLLNAEPSFHAVDSIATQIKYLFVCLIVGIIVCHFNHQVGVSKLFELGIVVPALLTCLMGSERLIKDTKSEIASVLLSHASQIDTVMIKREIDAIKRHITSSESHDITWNAQRNHAMLRSNGTSQSEAPATLGTAGFTLQTG